MELKHGYIQNPESIPAEYTGAGWIYFSEDDKAIYLDTGDGPIKFSGTEVDLSDYYTKEEINATIDNKIPSLEEYAKKQYVDEKIENIEIPDIDFSGYATETWVENKGYLTEHQDVSNFATKDDIPSLDGYVTEEFVINKIAEAELEGGEVDLSGYATKSDVEAVILQIPSVDGYVKTEDLPTIDHLATKEDVVNVENKIPSLNGYATEEFVVNKIAEAELADKDVDLSGYATKSDLQEVTEKIPSLDGYATEEFVTSKGYLTEHQDVSNLATKDEVAEAVEGLVTEAWVEEKGYLTEHQSLDGYATEEFVTSSIPTIGNGLENTDNSIGVKIDSESETFVSVSENGVKVSGIQNAINNTFNNYLNTQGFTGKIIYLRESEWEELKEQVDLGNAYWENNVIYMIYSND